MRIRRTMWRFWELFISGLRLQRNVSDHFVFVFILFVVFLKTFYLCMLLAFPQSCRFISKIHHVNNQSKMFIDEAHFISKTTLTALLGCGWTFKVDNHCPSVDAQNAIQFWWNWPQINNHQQNLIFILTHEQEASQLNVKIWNIWSCDFTA